MNNSLQILKNLNIDHFTDDSRQVKESSVFFSVPNNQEEKFITQAIKQGAAYIVTQNKKLTGTKYISAGNTRNLLSDFCTFFYKDQPKLQVAITGTNGKSSVCTFLYYIWKELGLNSANLGTLGLTSYPEINTARIPGIGKLTTLGIIPFHQLLEKLSQKGIDNFTFEASSHGLDQYRSHGAKIKVACFTSFSQDHLDYHQNMDDYLEAKLKLFNEILPKDGIAIINGDISLFQTIKERIKQKIITYGTNKKSDFYINNIKPAQSGYSSFKLIHQDKSYDIIVPLIGNFQIENLVCAIASAVSLGQNINTIINVIKNIKPPKGRLEKVISASKKSVFIDFAHTPDALSFSLNALRPYVGKNGKLWLVFGCGGDRDASKRHKMGNSAKQYADIAIITDDNPRTENSAKIRTQIIEGCCDGKNIAGREQAISFAIKNMQDHDILLIAGKGHEPYQIIGTEYQPFDDYDHAHKALT